MITVPELAADALGSFLANYMQRRYGSTENGLVELVPSIARIALECIGNSDALYHNVEHTMLVTLAGHDILRGRALHTHMPATDYAHLIVACLTHDIGYVRGIFRDDDERRLRRSMQPAQQDQAAARGVGRGAARLITSTAPSCSSWSASMAWKNSTAPASRAPSKARASPPPCRRKSKTIDEEAVAVARRRSDRATGRPALHPQGQRALLRIRRGRPQPPARL